MPGPLCLQPRSSELRRKQGVILKAFPGLAELALCIERPLLPVAVTRQHQALCGRPRGLHFIAGLLGGWAQEPLSSPGHLCGSAHRAEGAGTPGKNSGGGSPADTGQGALVSVRVKAGKDAPVGGRTRCLAATLRGKATVAPEAFLVLGVVTVTSRTSVQCCFLSPMSFYFPSFYFHFL